MLPILICLLAPRLIQGLGIASEERLPETLRYERAGNVRFADNGRWHVQSSEPRIDGIDPAGLAQLLIPEGSIPSSATRRTTVIADRRGGQAIRSFELHGLEGSGSLQTRIDVYDSVATAEAAFKGLLNPVGVQLAHAERYVHHLEPLPSGLALGDYAVTAPPIPLAIEARVGRCIVKVTGARCELAFLESVARALQYRLSLHKALTLVNSFKGTVSLNGHVIPFVKLNGARLVRLSDLRGLGAKVRYGNGPTASVAFGNNQVGVAAYTPEANLGGRNVQLSPAPFTFDRDLVVPLEGLNKLLGLGLESLASEKWK